MSHNSHDGFIRAPANCRLFVWSFSSHSRIVHTFADITIVGEGLHILTYARHLWPLSSEFFSVPHLLWHGASVYNGHLRRPVALIPNAERLAVELSIIVLRVRSVAAGIRSPNPPLVGRTLLEPQWHRNIYDLGCFNLTCWKTGEKNKGCINMYTLPVCLTCKWFTRQWGFVQYLF